jgi:hypothetical protein
MAGANFNTRLRVVENLLERSGSSYALTPS